MSKEGDVELAKKVDEDGNPIEDDEGDAFDEFYTRKSKHTEAPFFVFIWSQSPFHLWPRIVPFFLTHACIACAIGVFACNYGMHELVCAWLGLVGFVSCIVACSKIQEYAQMKDAAERMEAELKSMKLLMEKYEQENDLLRETLKKLEEQSEALQEESRKLERFTESLKETTDKFETGIIYFKRERKNLAETFKNIDTIVSSLDAKEANLQQRCAALQNELQNLRKQNTSIGDTFDNLVLEHDKLQRTNDRMVQQIEKFEEINQKCIDQQDVLKNTLHGNAVGMQTMMQNYEILFLQEVAHTAEFSDGQPGMTAEKFEEFSKRIPSNIQYPEDRLMNLFEEKVDENGVCSHEAMTQIITQIVKANNGEAGALLGSDEIEQSMEPSALVDL